MSPNSDWWAHVAKQRDGHFSELTRAIETWVGEDTKPGRYRLVVDFDLHEQVKVLDVRVEKVTEIG